METTYQTNGESAETARPPQEPLFSVRLHVTDHAGRRRSGRADLLPKWPDDPDDAPCVAADEDFRLIVLSQPPAGVIAPAAGVAVCAPGAPLRVTRRLREAAVAYETGRRPDLPIPKEALELLRQGVLFSAAPVQVRAEDVFAAGKAQLDVLARDLLAAQALVGRLELIAVALSAPQPPAPSTRERLDDLGQLIREVSDSLPAEDMPEAMEAMARLSELVYAPDTEDLLAAANRMYPDNQTLMEDIYLLRGFRQSPRPAAELLTMRRYLAGAVLPAEQQNLLMDKSLAMEQLSFVTLVVEPQRLPAASATLDAFRRRYVREYCDHHGRYWAEVARQHSRLREQTSLVDALRRLNTLAELGPPVGVGALAAFEELAETTAPCLLISGVEEMLGQEPLCPACHITLDDEAPIKRIDELLARVDRACERQMTRLSSNAVQQVLRRSKDPRIDQFLRLVQASQLSSLRELVDDDLIGYLRRFLVESRIDEALEPILDHLQQGELPKVDDARTAMREVSHILQRAFEANRRALPPGEPEPSETPARRKRKR